MWLSNRGRELSSVVLGGDRPNRFSSAASWLAIGGADCVSSFSSVLLPSEEDKGLKPCSGDSSEMAAAKDSGGCSARWCCSADCDSVSERCLESSGTAGL